MIGLGEKLCGSEELSGPSNRPSMNGVDGAAYPQFYTTNIGCCHAHATFWTSSRRPYNARRKYVFDVFNFVFVHAHLLRARGERPAAGETRYLCVREPIEALGVPFSRILCRYR